MHMRGHMHRKYRVIYGVAQIFCHTLGWVEARYGGARQGRVPGPGCEFFLELSYT